IDFTVHPLIALGLQLFFLLLVPGFLRFQPRTQTLDRILGPGVLDFVLAAIAAGVVGGGVVAEAIGDAFDHAAALAGARAFDRVAHGFLHRDDVVAVDLDAEQPRGDAFLRQRPGAGLDLARHRDRPLVVDDRRDQRQVARAGHVDGAVEIGLRGTAVADGAHRDALFLADLERQRRTGRVQALRADRHRPREVVLRRLVLVIVAALVAAPVHVHVARTHAALQLRAVLAIAGREHIFLHHRGADADVGAFVAEARRIRAELAGALQRDRLGVEHARGNHQLVQLDHLVDVLRELGQVLPDLLALGVEVLQVFDFKLGGDGHGWLPEEETGDAKLRPRSNATCGPFPRQTARTGRALSHARRGGRSFPQYVCACCVAARLFCDHP